MIMHSSKIQLVTSCQSPVASYLLPTTGTWKLVTILTAATLFFFHAVNSFGQSHHKDTTAILISDINVQLETTDAMKYLYNFEFDRADAQFRSVRAKYPWHPLPYFLV